MKRLYHATLNTIRGFAHAFRTEQAFRQEVAVLLVGLPIGIFVAPSAAWYVAMIGSLLAIMAVELLNTGIEKLADHVAPEWNPKIARGQGLRLGGRVLRLVAGRPGMDRSARPAFGLI